MKPLLDESLPKKFRLALPSHLVITVVERGWSGIKNGKLLALAAAEFDAFLTADQNLGYQQNLSALPLAVVVLVAYNNRLPALLPVVPNLEIALSRLAPCSYATVRA